MASVVRRYENVEEAQFEFHASISVDLRSAEGRRLTCTDDLACTTNSLSFVGETTRVARMRHPVHRCVVDDVHRRPIYVIGRISSTIVIHERGHIGVSQIDLSSNFSVCLSVCLKI